MSGELPSNHALQLRLHGVCFSFIGCLGRKSHNLWLGSAHAAQPTLTPESRHRFDLHQKPY